MIFLPIFDIWSVDNYFADNYFVDDFLFAVTIDFTTSYFFLCFTW